MAGTYSYDPAKLEKEGNGPHEIPARRYHGRRQRENLCFD